MSAPDEVYIVQVTEEWGLRHPNGEVFALPDVSRCRALVDELAKKAGTTIVRRTRTSYADHVTEWEAADE